MTHFQPCCVLCTGIIGHTAVYDSYSDVLLIYGGLLLIDMNFIESDSLYSLDMHSLQWSLLHVTSLNSIVSEETVCMYVCDIKLFTHRT